MEPAGHLINYHMDFGVHVHTDLALRDSGCHKDLVLPFQMDPVLLPQIWESYSTRFHHLLKADPVFHRQEFQDLAWVCTRDAQCALEHILRKKVLGILVGTFNIGIGHKATISF